MFILNQGNVFSISFSKIIFRRQNCDIVRKHMNKYIRCVIHSLFQKLHVGLVGTTEQNLLVKSWVDVNTTDQCAALCFISD